MAGFGWHKDRSDGGPLALIESDAPSQVDLEAVRRHRLDRVRAEKAGHDLAVCLLFGPVNIRYATDARPPPRDRRHPDRCLRIRAGGTELNPVGRPTGRAAQDARQIAHDPE